MSLQSFAVNRSSKFPPRIVAAVLVAGVAFAIHTSALAAGDSQAGAKIFAQNCARCHGAGGKGDGPDLVKLQAAVSPDNWTDKETNNGLTDDFIISMITKGGKANGKSRIMPAFADKLNHQQAQDLLAFIRSVAK
jgi:mono/diheme cytochrome c family protein